MREGLDETTIKALPRGRRWMYIVIDGATRYIVGFGLSSSQQPEATIRALHFTTRDKSDLAQAAGAKSDWCGFYFERLESDTGSVFKAEATQCAVSTSGATYAFGETGQPKFRAIIEQLFKTFTHRAIPYILGRTFSKPNLVRLRSQLWRFLQFFSLLTGLGWLFSSFGKTSEHRRNKRSLTFHGFKEVWRRRGPNAAHLT